MAHDWPRILDKLKNYPAGNHSLLAPCPEDRIEHVQSELGQMPPAVVAMLRQFNGGKLFVDNMPLIRVFGISLVPPLPPLEWAPDWYIDKYTPGWRSFSKHETEWAIGMWNYGNLVIADERGWVKEWDTSVGDWGEAAVPISEWFDRVLAEGDAFLNEV